MTPQRVRIRSIGLLLSLIATKPASAGMPSFTLADVKRTITYTVADPTPMRLEAISFFLLGILLCTLVVQRLWNSAAQEFAWLPRLSYGKALGVITLWGLLFVLVLTMISGARELMTPGAWEKAGSTYRLVEEPTEVEEQISTRYQAIERLGTALLAYGERRESFPTVKTVGEIPDRFWRVPLTSGERYVYIGGHPIDVDSWAKPRLLAYEPAAFGPDRLVLMTDGGIIWMPIGEIERTLLTREESK